MHTERSQLARYRLEEDITYTELASRLGRSVAWVHQFLLSRKPTATERSLHRVRKFLESVQQEQPTGRKSRKNGAAA